MKFIRISLIIGLAFLTNSCIGESCKCDIDEETLIQKIEAKEVTITLNKLNQGAFGSTIILRICDKERAMVEEVNLRGEDVILRIEHIVENNIYIRCLYPNLNFLDENLNIEIPFENMVLGSALLNKDKLKYNYIFKTSE